MTDECTEPGFVSFIEKTEGAPSKPKTQDSMDLIINALNRIHFDDANIIVNLKHTAFDKIVSFRAKPQPCKGEQLTCLWEDPRKFTAQREALQYANIYVPLGEKLLQVEAEPIAVEDELIRLRLPETYREINRRRVRRYRASSVSIQLIQNGIIFKGELLCFSAVSMEIRIVPNPAQSLTWLDSSSTVTIILLDDHNMLYSGDCTIGRTIERRDAKYFVLHPIKDQFHRFGPKKFRNTRQRLVPSPTVTFRHPFSGKFINLMVFDLAGGGMSVLESKEIAVLLPGMVIPEVQIEFAGNQMASFKAQVVYRMEMSDDQELEGKKVRCGLAVLDMSIEDHSRLLTLLHNATNKHFFLSERFDPSELWNFFFESGFIYPKKYEAIAANKKKIKEIYDKLYTTSPSIAKHFIYRDTRRILGHMAMVRAYSHSWLIHHHAANTSVSKTAGLAVLNQVGRFINDTLRLHTALMQYVFCYFRPENRFPNRVFGGATESIGDPKGCSVDTFAYTYYPDGGLDGSPLPSSWHLTETLETDLQELAFFYEGISGGLMLETLDLSPTSDRIDALSESFSSVGLVRDKLLFSLKKGDVLKAIVMVNRSDIGLNLSELINGLQFFVIDEPEVTESILRSTILELGRKYYDNGFSILLFPHTFAEKSGLFSGYCYKMWTLNAAHSDQYFKYLEKLLRFIQY